MIHRDLKRLPDARALDHDLAHDLARDHDLDHARDLARDLDLDLARDLARDLSRDRDLSLSHDLDRALSRDRDLARAIARAIARALSHALSRARAIARARARVGARDLTRDLDLDLVGAIEAARQMVTLLAAALSASAVTAGWLVQGDSGGVQPGRVAVGVVQRMVRVLPIGDRARFRQEFLAELHALAQEQAPRRVQLGHVLRAAAGMWSLRRVLRGPRPGRERAG